MTRTSQECAPSAIGLLGTDTSKGGRWWLKSGTFEGPCDREIDHMVCVVD